jgi:multidrug efflux pump subunit AcrA (membrane-fusion protein)
VVRGDVLELAGSVPERVAADVRPGQAVRLDVAGRQVTGRVARVSPTVDPTTRGITVFVEVPNPGGALKGNTFATGRAVGRVVPGALLVPTTALRQAQTESGGAAAAAASRAPSSTACAAPPPSARRSRSASSTRPRGWPRWWTG